MNRDLQSYWKYFYNGVWPMPNAPNSFVAGNTLNFGIFILTFVFAVSFSAFDFFNSLVI